MEHTSENLGGGQDNINFYDNDKDNFCCQKKALNRALNGWKIWARPSGTSGTFW